MVIRFWNKNIEKPSSKLMVDVIRADVALAAAGWSDVGCAFLLLAPRGLDVDGSMSHGRLVGHPDGRGESDRQHMYIVRPRGATSDAIASVADVSVSSYIAFTQ